MKGKIALITLGVRNFPRSLAFYLALGFERHGEVDGAAFAMFRLEGTWLALYPRDRLAEDATISAQGSGFSGITLAHNLPSPQAVDAAFAEALAIGATPVKVPREAEWGGYSGYFADPDGYLWELAFNPFTDLT